MKGSMAFGNIARAAARLPPCASGANGWETVSAAMSIAITLTALLIEASFGYPDRLVRTIGHPVIWFGQLIGGLDQALNRESRGDADRRIAGFFAVFCIVVVPAAAAFVVERYVLSLPFGFLAVGLLASSLLAQRSLHNHVERVASALEQDGIDGGREAVSHIVGRDPQALDAAGVCRA